MRNIRRVAQKWILVIAPLAASWSCSACAGDGEGSTIPPPGLLPSGLEQIRLGMPVEEVRRIAPGAVFSPYDGLYLAIDTDQSGFRRVTFFTGELYPERPPADNATLREIRLAGDSVDAKLVERISTAVGGARRVRRCAPAIASDVYIWQPAPPIAGVELIVSRVSPHKAHVRMFSGKWRETPATAGSTQGSCMGSAIEQGPTNGP